MRHFKEDSQQFGRDKPSQVQKTCRMGALMAAATLCGQAACKEYGQRKEYLVPPMTRPQKQSGEADAQLNLAVKRVNAQAWWKICVESWVDEFPEQRQSLGCNTDEKLPTEVQLPARSEGCNTLQFSFAVYKYTSPCTGDRPNCTHEATPAHRRQTSSESDRAFFRIATGAELTYPFADKPLADIRIPAEFESEYKQISSMSKPEAGGAARARIFLEDQTDENLNKWKSSGEWKETGIDFFDYVVEVSSSQAPFWIAGGSRSGCELKNEKPAP